MPASGVSPVKELPPAMLAATVATPLTGNIVLHMSDTDAQAAAQWMLVQITDSRSHELFQSDAADHIKKHFDEYLTYTNANGNLAIGKEALAAFRNLSDGTVIWEHGARYWRLRTERDPEGSRQAD